MRTTAIATHRCWASCGPCWAAAVSHWGVWGPLTSHCQPFCRHAHTTYNLLALSAYMPALFDTWHLKHQHGEQGDPGEFTSHMLQQGNGLAVNTAWEKRVYWRWRRHGSEGRLATNLQCLEPRWWNVSSIAAGPQLALLSIWKIVKCSGSQTSILQADHWQCVWRTSVFRYRPTNWHGPIHSGLSCASHWWRWSRALWCCREAWCRALSWFLCLGSHGWQLRVSSPWCCAWGAWWTQRQLWAGDHSRLALQIGWHCIVEPFATPTCQTLCTWSRWSLAKRGQTAKWGSAGQRFADPQKHGLWGANGYRDKSQMKDWQSASKAFSCRGQSQDCWTGADLESVKKSDYVSHLTCHLVDSSCTYRVYCHVSRHATDTPMHSFL